jgi:hypothetical protein
MKEDHALRRISSAIKPLLTEKNKVARLRYCLEHVNPDGSFYNFFDHIHIDEKWFYRTQTQRRYYLLPDEEEPYRTCKSKVLSRKSCSSQQLRVLGGITCATSGLTVNWIYDPLSTRKRQNGIRKTDRRGHW